jgi:predicted DsbA family dithiol-disulfide isomerase
VTWLPFDLHPEYQPEGIPRAELHARYGTAFHDRLRDWFDREGLTYAPPADVVPNTMLAQRLTELARGRGLHDALHDRLMDAYWAEGEDIGDPDVLRRLAGEIGIDDPEAAWNDERYRERVTASTEQAHAIGVTGVPAFLLDRKLLILGAQHRDTFEQAFARLAT